MIAAKPLPYHVCVPEEKPISSPRATPMEPAGVEPSRYVVGLPSRGEERVQVQEAESPALGVASAVRRGEQLILAERERVLHGISCVNVVLSQTAAITPPKHQTLGH